MTRWSDAQVDEAKAQVALIAGHLGLKLRKRGAELVGECPWCQKAGKFHVIPKKGIVHCFTCPRTTNAIGLAREFLKGSAGGSPSFDEIMAVLLAGEAPQVDDGKLAAAKAARATEDAAEAEAERNAGTARARKVWEDGLPCTGTLAEVYWTFRGLSLAMPAWFRFAGSLPYYDLDGDLVKGRLPVLWRGPAILAPMGVPNADGSGFRFTGLHCTWLARNGKGKAKIPGLDKDGNPWNPKRMKGPTLGAAVWITAPAARMVIAEGWEKTASLVQATGLAGAAPGSLGHMAAWRIPPQLAECIVGGDPGPRGWRGAKAAADSIWKQGAAARVVQPSEAEGDWSDIHTGATRGKVAA